MKQYNKIYYPDPDGKDFEIHLNDGSYEESVSVYLGTTAPVIVLTIEELKEMWDECRDETWQDARPTTKYEKPNRLSGFEGYIESKGLTIKQQ